MFAFHIDMNFAAFQFEALKHILELAASAGFDTILWEIEDKVKLETLGPSVHPDAMSKEEFKELLRHAERLHLRSCPLLQTLGHAEYVLRAPEHAELRENDSPDCYCASSARVRSFLKALITEIADLFDDPPFFHLGGDEAYNYRTCELCKAQPPDALFIEHELDLASILFARGIRPCLWADMLRHHPEIMAKFDRRFMIWLWDYAPGATWADLEKLRTSGYDAVICPASGSSGDSPFVSRWSEHVRNIRSAAAAAKTLPEPMLCMTSWTIRLGLKESQLPLWEYGKKIFVDGEEADSVEAEIRKRYFGEADPDTLCRWDWFLTQFFGVNWRRYKDNTPPPPGLVANNLKRFADDFSALAKKTPQWLAEAENALAVLKPDNRPADFIRQGGELRKNFLAGIDVVLHKRDFPVERLKRDERKFAKFLSCEQTPGSAAHNAALIYEPLIEYLTKTR